MAEEFVVYGSSWCGYTLRTLRHLEKLGVPFKYVDVDDEPAAERLIAGWNNGRAIRPTLDFGGGREADDVFVNPSPSQLESELRKRGLLS